MFRFTIRDVLWLMVVVGMVGAWFVDSRLREADTARVWREATAARQEMERAAKAGGYQFVLSADGLKLSPLTGP